MLYVAHKKDGVTRAHFALNMQDALRECTSVHHEVHQVPRALDGDCDKILKHIRTRRGLLFDGYDVLRAVMDG